LNDQHAEQIIRLLEEIRDGQRLQLERQAQALGERAEGVLAKSAKLAAGARILVLVAVPSAR